MNKTIILLVFVIFTNPFLQSQDKINSAFLNNLNLSSKFLGNSIGDIEIQKDIIWIAGSKGISKSSDNGTSWINYYGIPEFIKPNIAAFDIKGDTIWASLLYETDNATAGKVQTGGGYTYSLDGGRTWIHLDQAKDNREDSIYYYGNNKIKALPVIVDQQNVTWGISLISNNLWINSWSSGLRKSTDMGKTFKRIFLPPDSYNSISPAQIIVDSINPLKYRNHLGFSVLAVDTNEIWAGTAGGVNKTTDGGLSWQKFNHQNQEFPILGNWIYRIQSQSMLSGNRIWITNWKADDANEDFGASYTENGGKTWKNVLKGRKLYNFAFKDSIIFIGGKDGIFRSDDNGETYLLFDNIYDPVTKYKIMDFNVYSIAIKNDTVWIGTGDGLAYSIDNKTEKFGTKWRILRAYQPISKNKSYAYPNPFAPDEEIIRIHFSMPNTSSKITIEIFDFSMNIIKRVISNVTRSGNLEQEEIWNGKDEKNNRVGNGVYFYRVVMDNETSWGKIIVLQ